MGIRLRKRDSNPIVARFGLRRDARSKKAQPCLAFLLALWWPMAQPAAAPILPWPAT